MHNNQSINLHKQCVFWIFLFLEEIDHFINKYISHEKSNEMQIILKQNIYVSCLNAAYTLLK